LENMMCSGRRLMYEAMEHVLKGKDIELTPALFSRFALHPVMVKNLEGLLAAVGKKKVSVDKMAQDIYEQYSRNLKKSSVRLNANVEALLTDAAKAKVQTGALSFLPLDMAQELASRFGLKESLVVHGVANNSKAHPTADEWLKLTKAINLPAHRCLALTTAASSCKSALVAGMRCVVWPDAFTANQDFGGADLVIEDPQELRFKNIMALLHPCSFR